MRAQGSTEYLILLAAVMIIATIAATVLGIIPIGGDVTSFRQKQVEAQTFPVGVTSYSVSPQEVTVVLQSNLNDAIIVRAVSVNGTSVSLPTTPYVMNRGDTTTLTSSGVTLREGRFYDFEVVINYTEGDSSTTISQKGLFIEGYAASSS